MSSASPEPAPLNSRASSMPQRSAKSSERSQSSLSRTASSDFKSGTRDQEDSVGWRAAPPTHRAPARTSGFALTTEYFARAYSRTGRSCLGCISFASRTLPLRRPRKPAQPRCAHPPAAGIPPNATKKIAERQSLQVIRRPQGPPVWIRLSCPAIARPLSIHPVPARTKTGSRCCADQSRSCASPRFVQDLQKRSLRRAPITSGIASHRVPRFARTPSEDVDICRLISPVAPGLVSNLRFSTRKSATCKPDAIERTS